MYFLCFFLFAAALAISFSDIKKAYPDRIIPYSEKDNADIYFFTTRFSLTGSLYIRDADGELLDYSCFMKKR